MHINGILLAHHRLVNDVKLSHACAASAICTDTGAFSRIENGQREEGYLEQQRGSHVLDAYLDTQEMDRDSGHDEALTETNAMVGLMQADFETPHGQMCTEALQSKYQQARADASELKSNELELVLPVEEDFNTGAMCEASSP